VRVVLILAIYREDSVKTLLIDDASQERTLEHDKDGSRLRLKMKLQETDKRCGIDISDLLEIWQKWA
jgi:hypothetical protein